MKRVAVAAVKVAVAAVLIALVARAFDLRGLAGYFARLDAATAAAVTVIALLVLPVQTWRWTMVLDASATPLPFGRALAIVLIGHFFNQSLPSTVGGDAMRMWCAWRAGLAPGAAAASVVFDRVISLAGLLALTVCGLPWLLELVPDPAARSAIAAVVAAGIAGLLAGAVAARRPALVPDWRYARGFAARAGRLLDHPWRMVASLAFAAAGVVCFCAMVYLLAGALEARLTFVQALLLVPPVMLVSVIPVSVAGWGLREGAMVVALGFVGVEPAAAFAVSVLFGIAVAVVSLPGAVLWLAGGYAARDAAQVAAFAEQAQSAADERR
jgi:uncharacterized membrane protein YbhN (UPF0104 family)